MEVPEPLILHMETPSPFTPLGAKGLGEGNNMSTPVCIANAVADALGVRDVELPLTPSKIMDLIGAEEPPPSKAVAEQQPPAPAAGGKGGKSLAARGEVVLDASPEAVFRVLLDPVALAKVIPGCNALEAGRAKSLPRRRQRRRGHDQGALRRRGRPVRARPAAQPAPGRFRPVLGRQRARQRHGHAGTCVAPAPCCATTTRPTSRARWRPSAAACSRARRRLS